MSANLNNFLVFHHFGTFTVEFKEVITAQTFVKESQTEGWSQAIAARPGKKEIMNIVCL